ncbi:MAG TPA: glycosyl hydrolase family 18 protein [Acidothermaceae bacterium]|nr:glycosyl hydrolase family 18 protein [Acidothermaceae bacterium]
MAISHRALLSRLQTADLARVKRRVVAAAAALATVGSALVTGVMTAAPAAHAAPPPSKVVNAWLPWWEATAATQSATGNADLFNEASPFWFQATNATTIVIKPGATAAGLTSMVSALHARKIKAVPSVTDAMPAAAMAAILNDPAQRTQMVGALMSLVTTYNLDGIDMDYETLAFGSNLTLAPQIRAGYSALLSQLGATLHASGKMLTVAVLAKTQEGTSAASQAYNYAAIGAAADRVRLMTYDQHTQNTAYPGGAVASVQWVDSVLRYATSVIPASKIEMGVPLYGYDYSSAGGPAPAVTYTAVQKLMAQYHATRQWSAADGSPYFTYTATDGSQHTVWYNDAGALMARLPLVAKYNIAGISFWSLGDEDPGIWGALRNYTYGPNPFGSLDAVSAVPGGAQISGWALDPNVVDPVRVDIYSNNRGIGSTTANTNRPDIESLYIVYGAGHGFSTKMALPAGSNNVCAYAINIGPGGNTLLGCRTVNVLSGSPFGSFDAASPAGPGKVAIRGWSIDPDIADPTRVDVYVDGRGAASMQASGGRGDVARIYPGYGAAHGFNATLTVGGGQHQVCAFAINVGPGGNTLLGCRTVMLPTGNPYGSIDVAAPAGPGKVHLRGWTIDPDVADPTRVDVYVDGRGAESGPASAGRADIAAAFPGYGAAHGFDVTISVPGGKHQVCLFAINIGPGGNTLLGCRTVTMPTGSAFGSFDSVVASGAGQATVRGWAIDPDTADPIRVDMYVDGHGASSGPANGDRPDIAAAFAGYGAAHGFNVTLNGLTPGNHTVCVYAINVGAGSPSTQLGCKAVTTQ